jgi:hypothetical protein
LFLYRRLLRLARVGGGGRRHTFLLARGWLLLLHLGLEHLLKYYCKAEG